jgi:cellulose synthase/poly-beta-1,6-N-acetylglucosamine synthase-like glycosyltransferase/spore germination protein YaaH/peptidoglycan/xylan/chitin deacetylase (PgdA/CDA1 family)
MSASPQIFQTNKQTRWQSYKWSLRLLLALVVMGIVMLTVSMLAQGKKNNQPDIPLEDKAIKKVLTTEIPSYRESKLGKQYRGMRKFIESKWAKGSGCGQNNKELNLSNSAFFSDTLGIRAAFYVAWDPQSLFSLRRNINKVNLVLPEWFFINPNSDTLYTKFDENDKAYKIIKASGVKVMPMLSNFNEFNKGFNGAALHRIFNNEKKSTRLIADIVTLLQKNNFAGINVDFEELQEEKNETLVKFQEKLYNTLHAAGLLVTQNVSPFNEDYNYAALAKHNDYIFLMAYDQHSNDTKPGPVSSEKWIEACVDKLAQYVSPQKIVLNIAAYGYDWDLTNRKKDTAITYQEALVNARESDAVVDFDNDTYNLHYQYYDGQDHLHEVHFTDAATNFNILRFATEYQLAGTAVWRLGSEDQRLWDFYNRSMTKQALKNFNFADFNDVDGSEDVDYVGEGEIIEMISTPTDGHITPEVDATDMLISEEKYDKLPSTYVVRKWGKTSQKKIVLTFDDGPDPKYTKQILDTLAYYHVPASFFIVGLMAENNIPLVKRIFREGHEIGNHTFTHPNMAEVGKQRALFEMDATRLLIECITGHSTVMFRAPFNADSDPEARDEMVPIALSKTRNYITVGESMDPNDWEKEAHPNLNSDTILNRIIRIFNKRTVQEGDSTNIILLHDAGGDRSATVEATGKIIRYFRSLGYQFVTVANLINKKPNDVMPPVPQGSGYYLIQFNAALFEVGYWFGHIFYVLFLTFLILSSFRLIVLGILASLQKRKEIRLTKNFIANTKEIYPLVSIIVPAFNEEVNAVSSLQNLLQCNYPNFNIFFIDDGSTDATYKKVNEVFLNHPKIQLLTKPNGGKASALNYGIMQTSAEYVVCIDADTKLAPTAVSMLMQSFFQSPNENIGAVAGIVKTGNEINILTKWQSIEYTTSQNFDRKAFAFVNAISVIPGAIGAFKTKAIEDAGGFTSDTLAEDCDITIRILKAGYIIANQPLAVAYTEVPETLKQFNKQRFRWTFGVMQTFWKHKDALFNNRYKALGWIALPDMLFFKYMIPFFAPLGDILMLFGLFTKSRSKIGMYYLIFLLVDALIAALAFAFEKAKPWKLIWLIPQRLIYRWIMIVILFRSLKKAIKGELQNWGVLKRTGNVKDVIAT